jgi:hypothetical protein
MSGQRKAKLDVRGSAAAASVAGLLLCLAAAELLHGALSAADGRERREASRDLAQALGLTDLALFTEARYTRHRALADLHSAFQDAPMAMEHFPAGSLVMPQRAYPEGSLRGGRED